MINGLGYGYVQPTLYNFPQTQADKYNKRLQVFYYNFALIHNINKRWKLLVNLKPTLASDFEQKLSWDDLIFQSSVLATRKMNDKLNLGFGIANSTRWGSPQVVPVVSLRYKHKRHQVNAMLPASLKYTYSLLPTEKLKVGLKYAINGANFNIQPKSVSEVDKINYSRVNIGALANYQLTKILRIEAFGGMSAKRINRLVDYDKNVLNFDSESAPFFSIGIALTSPKR